MELTDSKYWDDWWLNRNRRKLPSLSNYLFYQRDKLYKEVLSPGDQLMLELGGGGSYWPVYFGKSFGYTVIGLDRSATGCLISAENIRSSSVRGLIPQGDLFAAPFVRSKFDIVFSQGLIEHFIEPCLLLSIAYQLLRPGGVIVTEIPNKKGFPGLVARIVDKKNYDSHLHITLEELAGYHTHVGFRVKKVTYFGSFSFGLPAPSGLRGLLYRVVRKPVQESVLQILRTLHWEPEWPFTSPWLFCAATKPP